MFFSFRLFAVRSMLALIGCAFLALVALLPAQAAAGVVIGGLTAYWDFNEAPGDTVAHNSNLASGLAAGRAALNGTLQGGADIGFAAGKFGNAARLDGSSTNAPNVYVPSQVIANGQTSYTLSLWFQPDDVKESGGRRQVIFETGANFPISVDLTAGDNVIRQHVETMRGDGSAHTPVVPTGVRPEQGEWHHLAISYTFDPDAPYTLGGVTYYGRGTQQIYVDGAAIGAPVVTDGVLRDTTFARIGIRRGNSTAGTIGTALNGLIDDTALWSRSLDARTIATIAGLGHVSGVSLNDYAAIDSVLAMNAVGQSATAGSDTWHYTNGLVVPAGGGSFVVGSHYEGVDGNHYIVLDGSHKNGFTGIATAAPSVIGGLTAYWDFNETSGATVAHNSNLASGLAAGRAALNGTLQGGADIGFAAGKFGNAVRLDGSSTNAPNVYVPSQVIANGQTAYTLSLWFQPDDVKESGGRRQVLFETGANYPISVDLTAGDNAIRQHVDTMRGDGSASGPAYVTNVRPEQGEWHHLAISYTFDPDAPYTLGGETYYGRGTQQIYVDGVAIGAPVVTDGVLRDTTFARIGIRRGSSAAGTAGTALNGLMDDTAIWNRALDSRSIAAIAGLGALAGLDLNMYDGIDAVLALDGQGQSATAGNLTWNLTDTFEYLPDGQSLMAGTHYIGTNGHYYIVLDGNGPNGFTGVWAVPEPGTFGLLLTGLLAVVVAGWRRRGSVS